MLALLLTAALCQTPSEDCRLAKTDASSAMAYADIAKTKAIEAKNSYLAKRGNQPMVPNDGSDGAQQCFGLGEQANAAALSWYQQGLMAESMGAMFAWINQAAASGYYLTATQSFVQSRRYGNDAETFFKLAKTQWDLAKSWY